MNNQININQYYSNFFDTFNKSYDSLVQLLEFEYSLDPGALKRLSGK